MCFVIAKNKRYAMERYGNELLSVTDRETGLTLCLQDKDCIKSCVRMLKEKPFDSVVLSFIRVATALKYEWTKIWRSADHLFEECEK